MNRASWKTRAAVPMTAAAILLAAACHRQTGTGARQPTPSIFVTVPPHPTPIPIPGRPTHTPVPPR